MALLVMLNNYMHDLFTAVFAVAAFSAFFFQRHYDANHVETLRHMARGIWKVGLVAFFFVLALGGVRAYFYVDFEWSEAAGRNQLVMLGVKHVILGSLTALGIYALVKVRKVVREQP